MSQEDSEKTHLKGSLLLADPSLRESTFFRSVLLLTEHSQEHGAFGYILNRPIHKQVNELIGVDDLPEEVRINLGKIPVFLGGPVATEQLTFSALGWSEEEDSLQYATHLSAIEASRLQDEGFQVRAFIGYSGWTEGQLEDELLRNAWIVHPPERIVVDPTASDHLWKGILSEMSPWHKLIAEAPEDPSLN